MNRFVAALFAAVLCFAVAPEAEAHCGSCGTGEAEGCEGECDCENCGDEAEGDCDCAGPESQPSAHDTCGFCQGDPDAECTCAHGE